MFIILKNRRTYLENRRKYHENHRPYHENHRKDFENHRKYLENHRKYLENQRKFHENHRKYLRLQPKKRSKIDQARAGDGAPAASAAEVVVAEGGMGDGLFSWEDHALPVGDVEPPF